MGEERAPTLEHSCLTQPAWQEGTSPNEEA